MRKAFKFRLYPNANQERELDIMLETHRRLYNAALEQRKSAYEDDGIPINYYYQSAWFKNMRLANPWYANTNFSSAQGTLRRLDKAYKSFFRRTKEGGKPGYPRFKARGRFGSVEFPAYGDGIRLLPDDKLRVQNVGKIKAKVHRAIEGKVKTATIEYEANRWFVILSCDLGNVAVASSSDPPVGIDVGIEHFLTTSDGEHFPNPRYLARELPELRRRSRAVSRKKLRGSNRSKAVVRLGFVHWRIKNLRHDHRHKASLNLCRRYGTIGVERLNIRGMVRNPHLSRAISDAAWGGFLETLKRKAESAGVQMVEVDPRGTSQVCSGCGGEVKKALSIRMHRCEGCGLVLHRDVNAARNILARARMGLVGANGKIVSVVQEAA